jgi:hypothetical protein
MARSKKQQQKYEKIREQIRKLSREGLDTRVISQRLGIAQDTVRKILKEIREEEK